MKSYCIVFVLTIVAFSLTSPVHAATVTNVPYDVMHTFNTRLIGNQVYRGAWQWFDHAIVHSIGEPANCPPCDVTSTGHAPFVPPAVHGCGYGL